MNVGLERKYVKNLINKFRGIRKVKLEVDEVYLYLGESLEGVHLPFKEVAKRFLSYAGVDYKRRGMIYRLRGKGREITRGVLSVIINGLIKALRDRDKVVCYLARKALVNMLGGKALERGEG